MGKTKDRIIKKLGGYTRKEHKELWLEYMTEFKRKNAEIEKNSALASINSDLRSELQDARATLAGLQILKAKIKTIRTTATIPRMLRSEKEIKREITDKTAKVVTKLLNEVYAAGEFVVVDVNDKGNKFEITATLSVLEGGVINETQLSKDSGGTGGTQESNEDQEND